MPADSSARILSAAVPLPPDTASAGLRVLLIVYRAESGSEVGRIDAGSLN